MKYKIGQLVWVKFNNHRAVGWKAGIIVGLSKNRPGAYLADVPDVPYHPEARDSEGYWRPRDTGLKPRDPPQQDWVKLCQLDNLPRDIREPSHV